MMASLRWGLGSEVDHQGSCSVPQGSQWTWMVTLLWLTMTTGGLASSPQMASSRWIVSARGKGKKNLFAAQMFDLFHQILPLGLRIKSALEDWWDPKVWPLIRMDISSRLTIRPVVSSSSSQMGSWWQSLEPGEHQTGTLQVLYQHKYKLISRMISLIGTQVVGIVLQTEW